MTRSIVRCAALAAAMFASPLQAATIVVGPPPSSIQAAINSATSGDTIQLSAGTYVQEVQVVSKSLSINGAGRDLTILQAPAPTTHLTQFFTFGSNFWVVLMVDNQAAPTPQTVNLSDLTVDGGTQQDTTIPPIYGSTDRFFAIGYHHAGGTIRNVRTTNTRQTANFIELAGGGIVNASSSGAVTFDVVDSLVDFYQRSGIDIRGATVTANVTNSTIDRGYVLTPNTATATPNGIQYSGGASGSVTRSRILRNISTVVASSATGVVPFGAGAMTIADNAFDDNDFGIAAIQSGNGLSITGNTVAFTSTPGVNPIEGIVVQDTAGLSILSSNVVTVPGIGMELNAATNQSFQLALNWFVGGQKGLVVSGSGLSGPVVTMSADAFVGTIGNYIELNTAPNDLWPSTADVGFDGLYAGHVTFAEFNQLLTKIVDKHDDPALGLVLDFVTPVPPAIASISPVQGPGRGGTTVTITGVNFLSSHTTVKFGAANAADVVVVSDTTIIANAPPGSGIVDVTVTTNFGTVTLVRAYSYLAVAAAIPVDAPWMLFALGAALAGFAARSRRSVRR